MYVYISHVFPSTIGKDRGDVLKLYGTYEVYGDAVATCGFYEDFDSVGSTVTTNVSTDQIECPLRAGLAVGDTQVTVRVYRQSSSSPNINYCYSHEGGILNEPGEYGMFDILPDRSLVLADLIADILISGNTDSSSLEDELWVVFYSGFTDDEQSEIISDAIIKAISDERVRWDDNNNGVIDIQDSVHILRVLTGQ